PQVAQATWSVSRSDLRKANVRSLIDEIDLHIVWMLVAPTILCILVLFSSFAWLANWVVLVWFLIPQGRILAHALTDLRPHGKPWRNFWRANEAWVFAWSAVLLSGWLLAR